MSKFKKEVELISTTSIRDFQSRMIDLANQDFYLVGSLVITKNIDTWIPFRLVNKYSALMQKIKKVEDEDES